MVRCFALSLKKVFDDGKAPNYLFTSANISRCNPKGVHCLYLGMDIITAQTEFEKYYPDIPPSILYRVDLTAASIIDLSDNATRRHLGITDDDLFGSFRLKSNPTPLQMLGFEVSQQCKITAIKFPSAACHAIHSPGNNIVIFKSSLKAPDSLKLYDPNNTSPDQWPLP